MRFNIVRLSFKSPLHIGEKEGMMEVSNHIIHSDTLFSALCYAYRLLYGKDELDKLLKPFVEGDPPFLLSSAFPFYKDIYFFPLLFTAHLPEGVEVKDFKKLRYLPKELWEEVRLKCSVRPCVARLKNEYKFAQDKKILVPKELQKPSLRTASGGEAISLQYPLWEEREIQRVSLDRVSSASNIFNFGEVVFQNNAGLFFLIDYKDIDIEKKLEASIRLLGDEGIGGDRTSGKGTFKPEFETIDIKDIEGKDYLLLSMYHPSEEELAKFKDFQGTYDFKTRGRYILSPDTTTHPKKWVRMFTEGSVIKNNKPIGRLVDVTPENFAPHRVYRYGLAFTVPMGG